MKRGLSAESSRASRSLLMALFDTAVEVDKGIGAPEFLLEFVACDDFAGTVNEQTQNRERLVLKFDADSLLPKFARLQICLEDAETNHSIYMRQVYQIRLQQAGAAGQGAQPN